MSHKKKNKKVLYILYHILILMYLMVNIIYDNNGKQYDKNKIVIICFVSYFDTHIFSNEYNK